RLDDYPIACAPAVFALLDIAQPRQVRAQVGHEPVVGGCLDLIQRDLDRLPRVNGVVGEDSRRARLVPLLVVYLDRVAGTEVEPHEPLDAVHAPSSADFLADETAHELVFCPGAPAFADVQVLGHRAP